jgi:hypothetical protein
MNLPVDGIPMLPPDVVAPEKQTLRYTTHPKLYAIPPEQKPAEGDFEGIYLSERHVPRPQPNLPQYMGEYTISIQATVGTSGELNEASQKIGALAQELDKFWVYGCGEPLSPIVTQLSFDITPRGWESNIAEIKAYLLGHCKQPFAVIQMNHQHWISMPYDPLRPALIARDKYQKANPEIKALADLHYAALRLSLGEGRLFSFAKALELARKILPGSNDVSKEKSIGLPNGSLKKSLHWLFDVGNNRFNTRHVVRKDSAAPALQPQMTGQEIMDYHQDADFILRSIVCQNLQVPTPNLQPATQQNQTTLKTT